MEPNAVNTGRVEVPSASAIAFAVRQSLPFSRTIRSAASAISPFVNLLFGAIVCILSRGSAPADAHRSMYIAHYRREEGVCQWTQRG